MIINSSTSKYTLSTVVTESKITTTIVKTTQTSQIEGRCWNLDGVPSDLVLTVDSYEQISGEFVINSTNHIGHKVYISDDNITFTLLTTLTGSQNSFVASGLTPDTIYYFKVVAYKVDITSPFEVTGNAQTEAIQPITINSITVVWDNINDEFDITVDTTGGTGVYTVTYTQNLNILNVVVTDTIGTTANQNVNLDDISPIVIDSATYEVVGSEAIVTIVASGGFGDLTYQLGSQTNITGIFTVTEADTYAIEVSDEGGATPAVSSIEVTIALEVPILNSLTVISDTEISIDYTSDYNVEVWISTNNVDFTKHGDSASTPYAMTGLTAGTLYYVKVRAKNGSKLSEFGSILSAETYQAEAQLFFAAAGTPIEPAYRTIYNKFVKNMKTDELWTINDWLHISAVPTADASLINIITPGTKNPILSATPPVFAAFEGYTGGANKFINTKLVLTTCSNYSLNSGSYYFYCRTNNQGAYQHGGVIGANNSRADLLPRFTDNKSYFFSNDATGTSVANTDSSGFFVVSRTASNVLTYYRNGVQLFQTTRASVAVPDTYELYELAQNNKDTAANNSINQISLTGVCSGLTAEQVLKLTEHVETLMDELGKGVIAPYAEVYDDTKLIDGVILEAATGYNVHTGFSSFKFETDATVVKIKVKPRMYSAYPQWSHITVVKDGTILGRYKFTDETYTSVYLGTGTKTVELIEEGIGKPSTEILGTFINSILSNGTTNTIDESNPTERLVFIGDSITNGGNASYLYNGYASLFKQNGEYINVYGYGYGSIYDYAGDGTKLTTLTGFLTSLLDGSVTNKIIIMMGTNDYGLNKTNASTFQTNYDNMLEAINTAFPTVDIFAITPIIRSIETANTFGNTLDDYRTAITNAASGKAYVTVIDGKTILATSDLTDGVHPSTAGHVKLYDALKTQF